MKVLEINDTDLVGRIFNGYDLHLALQKAGIDATQVVIDKKSKDKTVVQLNVDEVIRQEICFVEQKMNISNLLYPYSNKLLELDEFEKADIVHYHFPYHQMFSLLDYPQIMNENCVWTIHDPWVITGNCTHPLNCEKWKTGCGNCSKLEDDYFPMAVDNTEFMWKVKKRIFSQINPYIIVASQFMKKYIESSPLTCHFNKIHVIPFGIEVKNNNKFNKNDNSNKVVIGFRAARGYLKGCHLLYEALRMVKNKNSIELKIMGNGEVPDDICKNYNIVDYGWINDKEKVMNILEACDIFVIPSLAESFGLMAVEAMASKCAVICFKNTVVEEIINAPYCGISVKYMSIIDLAKAIEELLIFPMKRLEIQEKSYAMVKEKYTFDKYVDTHIQLFEEIVKKK